MDKLPNPGSREAKAQGCNCPVIDNHHGRGWGGDGEKFGWVMRLDCPLHGAKARELYGDDQCEQHKS